MNDKDRLRMKRIIQYCEQINATIERFGDDYSLFKTDVVYQNACCMCIVQIGEMASGLSEEAMNETKSIPWRQIRGMRNEFAHNYGHIDLEITWHTLHEDITFLYNHIQKALNE